MRAQLRRRPTPAQQAMSLRLSGVTGSYASTPDAAAFDITGDIDLRVRVALVDWTPAVACALVAKFETAGQYAYALFVTTTGLLQLFFSTTGSNAPSTASSTAVPFADGSIGWIRATRRSSDGRIQYFTAPGELVNPVAADFTQLGTDTTTTAGAMFSGTSKVEVGSYAGGGFGPVGKMYRAQIRSGLDGTLVGDFAASSVQRRGTRRPATLTDSLGVVWTVNGSDWDWAS